MLSACVVSWLVLSFFMWRTFGFSWPVLLSSALTVGVLYMAAEGSRASGWPLFWLLAALYGGIGVINIQFEVLAFQISSPSEVARVTTSSLVQVTLVSAIIALGMTRAVAAETMCKPLGLARRLWLRVPIVALAYVVLFMVAGSLILPYVRDFYRSSDLLVMPPLGALYGIEFLRGLVYVAAIAPLLRRMAGHRRNASIVAGLALSILGGIAPLLLPVDVIPPDVRRVHMVEIFCSNMTLGVIAAFLLVKRAPAQALSS